VRVEETAEAMQLLLDQGKIRAIGVSNFSVAQIERFRRVARLHVVQPPYNLFEREIEAELLPYCRRSDLATLTYGALCRGLLSGKLQEDAHFEGDDLRLTDPKFRPPRYLQYLTAVRRLDRFARQRYGKRVIHLAVRWLLDRCDCGTVGSAPRPVAPIDGFGGRRTSSEGGVDRILHESIPIRSAIHGATAAPQPRSWQWRSDAR
jgi:aryl-alcohol dehydrogenase-like predicted oxidoreductase